LEHVNVFTYFGWEISYAEETVIN